MAEGMARGLADAPHQQCGHGQNKAAATRRPSRAAPAQARGPGELRVDEGASRHARTTPRSSSRRFRLDPSLGASQSAATACQARAHHGTSCPWYTLALASLSGASTEVFSLQLWCWFGLGWSELKVLVSNSF
jgi:hypothetical protein